MSEQNNFPEASDKKSRLVSADGEQLFSEQTRERGKARERES
ncbi:MAG: hypothetical protein ACI8Z9_000076 [Paraglaciecola sp.]|jgi:hypothetical protein